MKIAIMTMTRPKTTASTTTKNTNNTNNNGTNDWQETGEVCLRCECQGGHPQENNLQMFCTTKQQNNKQTTKQANNKTTKQ